MEKPQEQEKDQTMTDDPRIEKLPKWAQDEIRRLRMYLREAEQERDGLRASALGPEDSPVFIEHYSPRSIKEQRTALDPQTYITFELGEYPDRIRVGLRNGLLNINGDDTIVVYPSASNDINIGTVRGTRP